VLRNFLGEEKAVSPKEKRRKTKVLKYSPLPKNMVWKSSDTTRSWRRELLKIKPI
jgi:hypothetical protein